MTGHDIPGAVRERAVRTVAEWAEAGVTRPRLRALVRTRDLVPCRRGVYATRAAVDFAGQSPRRLHALRVAAVWAAVGRDDVVASHHSAGRILGIEMLYPPADDIVSMTRRPPARSRNRREAGVVFRNAEVPGWQQATVLGVPVTSAARTVLDIARTSSFMAGVVAADSALRLGVTFKPGLTTAAEACRQWPGIEQARRVISFSEYDGESVLESCARVAFAEAGLEGPVIQGVVQADAQARFRVDFLWPRYRTIAEADGLGKLATAKDIRKQFQRDRLLRRAGYQVIHFTWNEILGTPKAIADQIREAFTVGRRG